ncbi:hypothetical protein SAMN02745163_00106 [Clostridium cavendishii DSM 21758]|uniref:Uncharacterized protein n=1 Tax=Clostridium cavendishii DSM 21758 TaxID=1121302 RepID=A0A1M6AK75_9CLOT|nr:hypothetical protein [Clostridium cavendishii]SHI36880.1 hypothetical protein SAMN02745163_00106 [Clostridium cavendishii DSM 21758]
MKRKSNRGFKPPQNELNNLKDDIKKVGYDLKDIYKKSNINIPKGSSDKTEIFRWILILSIVLILILSKIGIPFAILILIFILILLLYK